MLALPQPINGIQMFLHIALPASAHIEVKVVQESSGDVVLPQDLGQQSPGGDGTLQAIFTFDRIEIKDYGYYTFEVYLDGEFLDSRSIRVLPVDQT